MFLWAALIFITACNAVTVVPGSTTEITTFQSVLRCEKDWIRYGNYCYKYEKNQRMTWFNASKHCRSMGGYLASIHSKEENDFLKGLLQEIGAVTTWIGLEYYGFVGTYEWEDGIGSNFSNWPAIQPDDPLRNRFCASMDFDFFTSKGDWMYMGCGVKESILCQKHTSSEVLSESQDASIHTTTIITTKEETMESVTLVPGSTTEITTFQSVLRCENDWIRYGNYCYKFEDNPKMTWIDASEYCRSMGGYLASIHSKEENDFLKKLLQERGSLYTWIGMDIYGNDGTYKWEDGIVSNYSNWPAREPGPDSWRDRFCATIEIFYYTSEGVWIHMPCTIQFPILCQKHTSLEVSSESQDAGILTTTIITTKEETIKSGTLIPDSATESTALESIDSVPYCEDDWVQYENFCYKYENSQPMEWRNASAHCRSMGGHLAIIHSTEQNDFIENVLLERNANSTWIGLHGTDVELTYIWEDGTGVDFNNWRPLEPFPDHWPEGNCVEIFYNYLTNSGAWVTVRCTKSRNFLCQKQISTAITTTKENNFSSVPTTTTANQEEIASTDQLAQTNGSKPWFAEKAANVTVVEGSTATLHCVVENLGTHKLAWFHLGQHNLIYIHDVVINRNPRFTLHCSSKRNWRLDIRDVRPDDGGFYSCEVNTKPMISQIIYLEVVVPPNATANQEKNAKPDQLAQKNGSQPWFAEKTANLTVVEGSTAFLPCIIENLGKYTTAWIYEGRHVLTLHEKMITEDPRIILHHSSNRNWSLEISSVRPEDSGSYNCAVGTRPNIQKTIYLEVVASTSTVADKKINVSSVPTTTASIQEESVRPASTSTVTDREINVSPVQTTTTANQEDIASPVPPSIDEEYTSSEKTVLESASVSLRCRASGYPQPVIKWIREDRKDIIPGTVPMGEFLNFTRTTRHDTGVYLCNAFNGVTPAVSKRIKLNVIFPPLIDEEYTSSDLSVHENASVSLRCRASGYPQPVIKWIREDRKDIIPGTDPMGEFLNFTRTTRHNMGVYICIAFNGVRPAVSKRIKLIVLFAPNVLTLTQQIDAKVGEDVTLVCQVESSPKSGIYWMKGEKNMIVTSNKYRVLTETTDSPFTVNLKLLIRNLRPKDFRNYTCVARNSLGISEGLIFLHESTSKVADRDINGRVVPTTTVANHKEITFPVLPLAVKSTEKSTESKYNEYGAMFISTLVVILVILFSVLIFTAVTKGRKHCGLLLLNDRHSQVEKVVLVNTALTFERQAEVDIQEDAPIKYSQL